MARNSSSGKGRRGPETGRHRAAGALRGTVLVSFQREALVQPDASEHAEPLAVALPRTLYRELGRIVAGDRVAFEPAGRGGKPVVVQLEPRTSQFSRAARDGRRQLLFTNLDLLVICATPTQPPFRPGLVDRLLVAAAAQELDTLLLLNKTDLADTELPHELLAPYRELGYPAVLVSARTGRGLPELASAIAGRRAALVGHSGVGKSSLINQLVPGASLQVGGVAETTGKGQHTTTRSRLLPLPFGGFVLDSPGLRAFGLSELEPQDVARLFPDFAGMPPCRFTDCLHLVEQGCKVREAVEKSELAAERYLSYQRLVLSLDRSLPVDAQLFAEPIELLDDLADDEPLLDEPDA